MLLYLEMSQSKFTSKYAVTNTIKKNSRHMDVRIRCILVWKMRLPPCRHFCKENDNKNVKIIENWNTDSIYITSIIETSCPLTQKKLYKILCWILARLKLLKRTIVKYFCIRNWIFFVGNTGWESLVIIIVWACKSTFGHPWFLSTVMQNS